MQFYKDLLKKELTVLHFPHGTNSFKLGENVVRMSAPCLKSVSSLCCRQSDQMYIYEVFPWILRRQAL